MADRYQRLRQLLEVKSEQRTDIIGLSGQRGQGLADSVNQVGEEREVVIVGGLALGSAPQILNGIEIRRITGQLDHGEAVSVLSDKGFDEGGAVIRGTLLDDEQGLAGLGKDGGQEVNISSGVQLALDALKKQLTSEEFNQAENLISFAFAAGLNERLLADRCPGVAQTTPLGETGFIAEQDQSACGCRLGQKGRPRLVQPH